MSSATAVIKTNLPGGGPAYLIKIAAEQDGTFTVTNTRTGFSKTYKPRRRHDERS